VASWCYSLEYISVLEGKLVYSSWRCVLMVKNITCPPVSNTNLTAYVDRI
jgi:hypothetical protein